MDFERKNEAIFNNLEILKFLRIPRDKNININVISKSDDEHAIFFAFTSWKMVLTVVMSDVCFSIGISTVKKGQRAVFCG